MSGSVDTTDKSRQGRRTPGRGRRRLLLAVVTGVVIALAGVVPAAPVLASGTGDAAVARATAPAGIGVTAVSAGGSHSPAAVSLPIATPGAVVPVTPARIADSRVGRQIDGAVPALGTARVQVTGRGQIPAHGVAAVLATVTVVAPQRAGYLTAWASGTARPGTSNVNFRAGQTIANTVITGLSAGGGLWLFNGSDGTVQLIVDVTGYTRAGSPTAAGAVVPVAPTRIVDSRGGLQLGGPVPGSSTLDVQIGGRGGIPLGGVGELVATVTVVDPQQSGYLTLWASGTPWPGTSNLNFQAGQTIAGAVIVPVGSGGRVQLFNGSPGSVQVLLDVTGYTVAGRPISAGTLWWLRPSRIEDTRVGFDMPGRGPVPALGAVGVRVVGPGSLVVAAVVTVTVVSPAAAGHVTVWRSGVPMPGTSNVNFQAGQNVATTVIVPVGADGQVQLFNGSPGGVHLVVDIGGYTLAADTPTNGGVWAWGDGPQLGNGDNAESLVPVPVFGLGDIIGVAAGTYAVRGDGTVWAWGGGVVAVANGSRASFVPLRVSGLTGITAVAGGGGAGYALRGDGTVWAWGCCQLGDGTTGSNPVPVQVSGLTDVTAVAGGYGAGYAVRGDGTLWAWGASVTDSLTPVQVSGLTDVTAVAVGFDAAYALRADGTVWTWGRGAVAEQVSGLTGATAVAGGRGVGYALRGDGTVWAWGSGAHGQLGNGSTESSTVPVQVSGLTDAIAIAAAGGYLAYFDGAVAYALRADGTVMAWGTGQQLGNGTNVDSSVPVPVSGLTGVTAVAAGPFNGYAIVG